MVSHDGLHGVARVADRWHCVVTMWRHAVIHVSTHHLDSRVRVSLATYIVCRDIWCDDADVSDRDQE